MTVLLIYIVITGILCGAFITFGFASLFHRFIPIKYQTIAFGCLFVACSWSLMLLLSVIHHLIDFN